MTNVEEDVIWTEEKCIQLIREYKSKTSLWDSRDPRFYKQSVRPEEWKAIGEALNVSANDCKYKMNILMSSFRREKAKFINSLKTGKLFVSTWFGFNELSFLMKRKVANKKKLNADLTQALLDHHRLFENNKSVTFGISINNETIDEQEEEYDNEIKVEPESDPESDSRFLEQTFVPTPGPSEEKCERVKTYNVETSTDPIDEEEITAFTDFIKSKMKKYSEKTIIAVEKAIFNILFKADRNYYENDDYESLEADLNNTAKRKLSLKRKRNSNANGLEENDQQLGENSD